MKNTIAHTTELSKKKREVYRFKNRLIISFILLLVFGAMLFFILIS